MKKLFFFGVALIITSYALDWLTPYDDTDPPGGRSGAILITDHATGCQYLRAGWAGGITPRIDADGVHMGCKGLQGDRK